MEAVTRDMPVERRGETGRRVAKGTQGVCAAALVGVCRRAALRAMEKAHDPDVVLQRHSFPPAKTTNRPTEQAPPPALHAFAARPARTARAGARLLRTHRPRSSPATDWQIGVLNRPIVHSLELLADESYTWQACHGAIAPRFSRSTLFEASKTEITHDNQ